MVVLGINCMHDASSALVADSRIVAAAEEERFNRVKHAKSFPRAAVEYCLEEAGCSLGDVDVVVASWRPWVLDTRAGLAFKSLLRSPRMFSSKASRGLRQMGNEWRDLFFLRKLLRQVDSRPGYEVRYADHHLSHAASTFYCSPFDESAILTVDGAGERHSTVLWHGKGLDIERLNAVRLPHSLGQLYSATTAFLGFRVHHDEYKVMGLAANGTPRYTDYLIENVGRPLANGGFALAPYYMDYHLARRGQFETQVTDLFGPPRRAEEPVTEQHADVAASVQAFLEHMLFHVVRDLHAATGSRNLCLAGGVALNCVANGKLFENTPFENIFVQPAAGDNGTSLGAALLIDQAGRRERTVPALTDAYLGPAFTTEQCAAACEKAGLPYRRLSRTEVVEHTARRLAEGKVIGWFQGRMEWGPRALGARSLIADPRRPEIKESINRIIKKREPFRPFAPSVLAEHAADYFEGYRPSPFMLFTFPVKASRVEEIPAVVHTDGTARPQGVRRDASPLYYDLIDAFHRLTGVPMILNTSFNVQEPIVCTPDDAVSTYVNSEMDHLVMEDVVVEGG